MSLTYLLAKHFVSHIQVKTSFEKKRAESDFYYAPHFL